jgi:hypothetical protein
MTVFLGTAVVHCVVLEEIGLPDFLTAAQSREMSLTIALVLASSKGPT